MKRRLQPLSVQEAMAGPGLSGLDDVLKTMVESSQPASGTNASARLMLVSPGVTMTPGELKSPGDAKSAHKRKEQTGDSRTPVRLETMQQGLNASEQTVYHCLFAASRDNEDRVRNLSIRTISAKTGLSERTCQRVLRELSAKQVIKIQPPPYGSMEAPVYLIASYASALQLWRQLGFTHVQGGRTRVLVDPLNPNRRLGGNSRQELPGAIQQPADFADRADLSPGEMRPPGDSMTPPPGDLKSRGPGDMKSPLSIKGNKNRNNGDRKTTTTNAVDVVAVVAAMCEYLPGDRAAAEQIAESAIALCPDCTTSDVVTAVRRKAAQLRAQEGIKNPVAVLISSCDDLALAARTERLTAEAQQSGETAREEQARRRTDFFSFLHGLPADNTWRQILENIRHHIPTQAYETWLNPTQFAGLSSRVLRVCVPSHEFKHIGEKYADLFNQAMQALAFDIAAIEYLTIDELIRKEEQTDAH